MASMDVFNSDAFSMTSLSSAIMTAPYKPRLLGNLGLFTEVPIRTPTAFVEKKGNKLAILHTANRGTVKNPRSTIMRDAYPFTVPHIPQYQTILADDIFGVRAFGSETELQAMGSYVNDQLIGMRDNHEVTWEYHRVGALKGEILDGDNSTVIYNLFTEFGLSQTTVAWYSTDTTFADTCTEIIRTIADKLGNDNFGQITALCGNDYFDAIVGHDSMADAYDRWRDGEFRRVSHLGPEWYSVAANGFMYQNILFINYRGKIDDVTFIPDDEAYYFPIGVPQLFQEIVAPANFMETVNTRGQRLYVKQKRMDYDMGVELHSQSNYLAMCTRPDVVIKSTWAATSPGSSSS